MTATKSNPSPPPLTLGKIRLRSLTLATISVVISVTLFGGGGWLLDTLLDKKPTFFIIGMVVAFVFTNIFVVLLAKVFPLRKA